jgi:hypothetical protein
MTVNFPGMVPDMLMQWFFHQKGLVVVVTYNNDLLIEYMVATFLSLTYSVNILTGGYPEIPGFLIRNKLGIPL